jgi:hypothetical protein
VTRRRGESGRNALGVVLIVLAVLVLGGLGGASFMLRAPPTDAETLCRTDAPLAAHTIILVDSTDRLETRHRRKLRAVLAQERARLSQYERLTVMRINVRRPQEPTILFSKCLPRPPEQTNPLFENARMAQQRWDEEFADALDRALRTAGASGPARASPIVAGVQRPPMARLISRASTYALFHSIGPITPSVRLRLWNCFGPRFLTQLTRRL